MPSAMGWKEMYQLEYYQMKGEGYEVSQMQGIDEKIDDSLAFNLGQQASSQEGSLWYKAYQQLITLREKGIRKDFAYHEPDDLEEIFALADQPPELAALLDEQYKDRVRGGWFARCAAVILGKPLEMGFDRLKIKEYLESVDAYPLRDWVPARSEKLNITLREDCLASTKGNVSYVQSDDDIHYTICALLLAEKNGEYFTPWQGAQNLLDNLPYNWVWTADKYLYYQLIHFDNEREFEQGLKKSFVLENPWRESMCPQLKADLWGYITPGETRRGAKMIHRLGSLCASKNGLYGGMFIQGCVSAAMSKAPTVDRILRGGLSNIPNSSRLYEAVMQVREWHRLYQNWIKVSDKIYEVYGHWYFAGAINNICFIVLALLEGNLDLEKTMCTAVMCGTDTDCNSANAGSIVGAAVGYKALDRKWIDPLNDCVKSCVAGFGFGTISDLAERTIEVYQKINEKKG